MSNVVSLFDYIFYRIYKFFHAKGDAVPDTKGALILSLMQCLTILDIMVVVKVINDYPLPSKLFFFLPLVVIVGFVNWLRYERDFDIELLEDRWGTEDNSKRIMNGWFIGLYLVMSFLIPAVYGYLKYNLNTI